MVAGNMKSFGLLCRQVTEEPALTTKREIVAGFLARYTGDVGLLLKLLLPKYAQRVYYTQEKQLMRVLAVVLCVAEETLRDHLNRSGCIAETALAHFCPTVAVDADGWCDMTMEGFDSLLDDMAAASTEIDRIAVVKRLFAVACKNVAYYFFRELKQDLRLGAGLRVVLGGLHPAAYEVFQNCANVQEVVRRIQAGPAAGAAASPGRPEPCADGGAVGVAHEAEQEGDSNASAPSGGIDTNIAIGIPLAPMLAAPARSVEQVLDKCPNGAFSEVKYDGERIQIHKRGNSLTFFARSLQPMRADKYAGLEPYILQAIRADECVLDGEILMVDIATSVPLPFGTLGKHKRTQFSTACPCVFLFDILYRDGQSLLRTPFVERREAMRSSVQFIRNRVMFSELCLVEGRHEQRRAILQQHLRRAIAEGLEGLVIKDVKGVYEPRARHWLKIKKDYLEGLADSADLLVLGAWYGSGNKGGQLSTFLMGCIDPAVPAGAPGQYKTVCKVGNGLRDAEVSAITNAYSTRMVAVSRRQGGAPAWLDCHSAHLPDLVLRDPGTADVMEIVGAELSATKTHTSGISVRFPRILRMRLDKTTATSTTLRELQHIFRTSRDTLASAGVSAHLQLVDSYAVLPQDDEDSLAAAPERSPAPREASAAGADAVSASPEASLTAPPTGGVSHVAKGDATAPAVPASEPFMIFHTVAVQGRWSPRGIMGRISHVFGPTAATAYEQAAPACVLGQVLFSEVGPADRPGRVFVASAVAHHAAPPGQVPLVDQRALESTLADAIAYAQRNGASLHVVPPAADTQPQTAPMLQRLAMLSALRGVAVTIYGVAPPSSTAQPPATGLPCPLAAVTVPAGASPTTVESARPTTPINEDTNPSPEAFVRGRDARPTLLRGVVAQIVCTAADSALASEVRAELAFMQGTCARSAMLYERIVRCTHVVCVGDVSPPQLEDSQRLLTCVVGAAWVRDCFRDGVRYAEAVYRLDSSRPTARLLAGQCLLLSDCLRDGGAARWLRLAGLLGAEVHATWQTTGRRLTTLALTDAWDRSCAAVYERGGWVVHCQWLEDCAVAAAVLPLDAYVFSPAANARSAPFSERPLHGLSLCFWPLRGDNHDKDAFAAVCRDELGAELTVTAAAARYVVLLPDTPETRRSATSAGVDSGRLVNVDWLRRCAVAGTCIAAPDLCSEEATAALQAEDARASAAGARVGSEPRSEGTSSTDTYVGADD